MYLLARLWPILFAVLAILPASALADDNRLLTVSIEAIAAENNAGFRVSWKVPVNIEARHVPVLSAPQACSVVGEQRNWSDPMGHWREEVWRCPDGLPGSEISIQYPLANPNLATIVRYHPADGAEPQTILLQPQDAVFSLSRSGEERGSFADFLILGVEHILIGIDHLLFVAGLIFIAGTVRRVLATITGFTLAHSVTLALSALDLVRLPIAAIEAVIALSIVFLAVEIVKGPRDTLTWRSPIFVASSFGLLHGFGFAAVLKEIGLPSESLVTALLAFNLGIEIGQVVFAGIVLLLLWPLSRIPKRLSIGMFAPRLAGYAVGTLASFWMFERMIG